MEKTEQFTAPAGLMQAIADYLQTRPYKEVVNLMAGLTQTQLTPATPADDAKG